MKRTGEHPLGWLVVLGFVAVAGATRSTPGRAQQVTLRLQTRDAQNQPQVAEQEVEAARIGVVVMDMWDRHWDPQATRRVAALVPRMIQFLHNARAAAAQVIFSPSNTINAAYAATKQRFDAVRLPRSRLPQSSDFQPAQPIPWTTCPRNMDGTAPYHSPPRSAWSNQCPWLRPHGGRRAIGT